jgi:hypothetical protein
MCSVLFERDAFSSWAASDHIKPANLGFEPSPVWHDDASIIADEAAKVFLRNVLS